MIVSLPGLQRIDQRTTERQAGGEADPGERLARQPGDARRLRTQPHGRDWLAGQRPGVIPTGRLRLLFLLGVDLVHDAGLPSVRETRTRF